MATSYLSPGVYAHPPHSERRTLRNPDGDRHHDGDKGSIVSRAHDAPLVVRPRRRRLKR